MSNFYDNSQPTDSGTTWRLELFQLPSGQIPFATFRDSLDPFETELLDLCILKILAREGNNVCGTNWGKPLGAGLYEFRINRSLTALCKQFGIDDSHELKSGESKLMRVFFTVEGQKIILLLCGYDKGKDPSRRRQHKAIKSARMLLKQHKNRG